MSQTRPREVLKFAFSSEVDSPIEPVWSFITSPTGINYELMPVMRMTVPRSFKGRTVDDVQPGEHLGRAWLLLAGILPFDFDNITVAEIEPGVRFKEQSTTGSFRSWQHERSLAPIDPHTTRVTDSMEYVMRLPLPGSAALSKSVLRLLFRHRHRRLANHFGR